MPRSWPCLAQHRQGLRVTDAAKGLGGAQPHLPVVIVHRLAQGRGRGRAGRAQLAKGRRRGFLANGPGGVLQRFTERRLPPSFSLANR